MMEGVGVNFHPNFESCSVESLLSVPIRFIFGETRTCDRVKAGDASNISFMFSKGEVSTLLRVSMLSSELDALLSLAYDALDRSQKCKTYHKYIEEANKDSTTRTTKGIMLRALLPILTVHSETSEVALNHATCESFGISRVLNELETCATDLGKFAEQNHTMADQLDCYMAAGQNNILSNEKRAIAEIEEAVVERIENLSVLAVATAAGPNQIGDTNISNGRGNSVTAMSGLCESLFPREHTEPPTTVEKATESQMFAAEALQFFHSNSREK